MNRYLSYAFIMLLSKLLIPTIKDIPADADMISHKLMLRAGLIRQLASGIYSWLPLGVRVLHHISDIVYEEFSAIDGQEVMLPTVQPTELWQETDRLDTFGEELLTFQDRHDRHLCYAPTNEEVITDLVRNELSSYKQLPALFYQIRTKFRDELRPCHGVIRAREFLMNDAYSFHIDDASLNNTYQQVHQAYSNIFNLIGVDFYADELSNVTDECRTSHSFFAKTNKDPIEIACLFKVGSQYTHPMDATILDEHGISLPLMMGSYGLGISRAVAAIIEQSHDDKGIIWPESIAPFQVIIVPMHRQKSYRVRELADSLYHNLRSQGVSVLYDDRHERPGQMLYESDLLGIPHRIIISEKHIDANQIEYKARKDSEPQLISLDQLDELF